MKTIVGSARRLGNSELFGMKGRFAAEKKRLKRIALDYPDDGRWVEH